MLAFRIVPHIYWVFKMYLLSEWINNEGFVSGEDQLAAHDQAEM